MKRNTIVSIIAISLCFMVGYVAYETAFLLQTWVAEKFSDCKTRANSNCTESNENPLDRYYRR